MALTVYATDVDYANWTQQQVPTNVTQLLRSASIRVARACFRDPYTDVPTGTDADALRDATCAQAAAWVALGVDPDAAGLDTKVKVESKIGTADIKYDTIPATQVQAAVVELAPQAQEILTAAGLIYEPVPTGASESDRLSHYGLDRRFSDFVIWSGQ